MSDSEHNRLVKVIILCSVLLLASCNLSDVTITPDPTTDIPPTETAEPLSPTAGIPPTNTTEFPTPTRIVDGTPGVPIVTPIGGQPTPVVFSTPRPPSFLATVNVSAVRVRTALGADTSFKVYGMSSGGEIVSVWEPLRENLGGWEIDGMWCPIAPNYSLFVACRYLDRLPD